MAPTEGGPEEVVCSVLELEMLLTGLSRFKIASWTGIIATVVDSREVVASRTELLVEDDNMSSENSRSIRGSSLLRYRS